MSADGCRIRLVYLPAYAPNLNLIERLWWLFKRKTLYNQHFPTFAQFKAAVDGFFSNIASYRDEIRTLISGAFHFIGTQNPPAPMFQRVFGDGTVLRGTGQRRWVSDVDLLRRRGGIQMAPASERRRRAAAHGRDQQQANERAGCGREKPSM